MAKIKFGAIVVDGRGKLGGHVLSSNKSGNYIRTKVTPNNPQTPAQTTVRQAFATISSGWSGLTDAQRESYSSKVEEYGRTNIFGDLKNPSGKALYQRLNNTLLLAGKNLLLNCPNPTEILTSQVLEITCQSSNILEIGLVNSVLGSVIKVTATPSLSAGTMFVKNKLRVIKYITATASLTYEVSADYNEVFGSLSNNDNIFVGVSFINANGQESPMQVVKVIYP